MQASLFQVEYVAWLIPALGAPLVLFGVPVIVYALRKSRRAYVQTAGWLLSLFWWSFVGLVVLALGGLALGVVVPFFGILVPLLLVGLTVLAARVAWVGRRQRAFTVVCLLEQAVRMGLPMPTALRAAMAGEDPRTRSRLEHLASWLEAGGGLSEGLERHVPETRATQLARIDAAERTGTLPTALAELHAEDLAAVRGEGPAGSDGMGGPWLGVAYGAVVAAGVLTVSAGIALLIFPKYIEIFDDFGVMLPWATRVTFSLLNTAYLCSDEIAFWLSPGGALLVGSAAGLGLTVGVALQTCTRAGEMPRGVASVLRGWWGAVPGLGLVVRRGAWARSLDAMSLAVASGVGLPAVCDAAGRAAVDRGVERAWARLARRTEAGDPLGDAAKRAGLRRFDRSVLADALGPSDLENAAAFLATCHAAARDRALLLWRGVALPAVIVVMAAVVGWLCYAMFAPLVVLIESVIVGWRLG
ncbi:MAG: type II secretion system F family protein [Planctomycetota bacterium]